MVDRDMLVADLLRLAGEHKDYSGTVERVEGDWFRLRYYPKPDEAMIEDRRVAWNEGVRALDAIAPRVIQFANENGISLPAAETARATVMAWVLQERFPANRVSASALTNAFDAIRETILRLGTHDFADSALQRLRRHDKFEEGVRQDEIASREAHIAQREKLKDACRRLKQAIKAYNAAHYDGDTSGKANGHLACEFIHLLAVIDELGLGPTLDSNAQRKDKPLLSGQLEDSQVGYIKNELRLHLALIKCRNSTEQDIVPLLAEIGLLSPSSCDDLWIDLWHYEQFTDGRKKGRSKLTDTGVSTVAAEVPPAVSETSADSTVVPAAATPAPFTGGDLVFYEDRVELCSVDICSGKGSKRIALELLSEQRKNGEFIAYSLEELGRAVAERGGRGAANGLIRDLRDNITERLLAKANIVCDRMQVILSRGGGYRFSENLSVQWADPSEIVNRSNITHTAEMESPNCVGDGDGDVVGNDKAIDGDDVGNEVEARKTWILEQLAVGKQLKAGHVADHFDCSIRTAERALTSLKDQGLIEYVGNPRTGYYRLVQSPEK